MVEENVIQGFPGGSEVKNPLASAGVTGVIPDLGKFHMSQSNWTPGPQLLSLCPRAQGPQQENSAKWEARALQLESSLACRN